MRILSLLHVCFMVLDTQAFDDLPKPENLTMVSNNFDHMLQWTPGVGTPPGTVYTVELSRGSRRKKLEKLRSTTLNVSDYMKDITLQYIICMWASLGNRSSPVLKTHFTPYTTTVIGPPAVTLAGCGDCLNISISLPKGVAAGRSKMFYEGIVFTVQWRKDGDDQENELGNKEALSQQHNETLSVYEYVLPNIQSGAKYCVRAKPHHNVNENTLISDWVCALTSTVAPKGALSIAGWTTGFVLVGLGVMITIAILIYTGFLCKQKTSPPKVLTSFVPSSYLLPEGISLAVAVMECHGKSSKSKCLQTEERSGEKDLGACRQNDLDNEEEEEEENDCLYMYRPISESDSSATNSGQSSTSTAVTLCEVPEHPEECSAEPEHTGSGAVTLSQLQYSEVMDHSHAAASERRVEKPNPPKPKDGGGQAHAGDHTASTNVNLLSVTLRSLQREDEEEDDAGDATELSRPFIPLLLRELAEDRPCLSQPHTGKPPLTEPQTHFQFQRNSQTERPSEPKDSSEARTGQTVTQERTLAGYMATHAGRMDTEHDCLLEEEEEEEQEEEEEVFSGYMER